MKLEAGKKYVDRRGRIYGPLFCSRSGSLYGETEGSCVWRDNGSMSGSRQHEGDLIAEHVEIVPGNHWVSPVDGVSFTVVGSGGSSFRMPDQDADFVGEFDGMIYSKDPCHVMRAGVDQVCVLGKWTTWSQCGSSMLEEAAFTRVRYPKSAAPVKAHVIESPDDLVEITDPSHKLRKLIDFVWSVSDEEWTPVRGLGDCTVGYLRDHMSSSYTKPSCYRKDLPVSQTTIDPGQGYRILNEDEVTRPTDERMYPESPSFGWAKLEAVSEMTIGAPVSVVREKNRGYRTMVIRRKIEPAVDTVEVELCVNKINPYAFCLLARPVGESKHGEVALRFADGKFYIDTPKA